MTTTQNWQCNDNTAKHIIQHNLSDFWKKYQHNINPVCNAKNQWTTSRMNFKFTIQNQLVTCVPSVGFRFNRFTVIGYRLISMLFKLRVLVNRYCLKWMLFKIHKCKQVSLRGDVVETHPPRENIVSQLWCETPPGVPVGFLIAVHSFSGRLFQLP